MSRSRGCRVAVVFGLLVAGLILGVFFWGGPASDREWLQPTGGALSEGPSPFFTPIPSEPYTIPRVEEIKLPEVPGANAIWGGTGRDDRGGIWFGLCMKEGPGVSAQLVEYIPEEDRAVLRGDVLMALAEHGLYRSGEAQAKIHTRIVQAADGNLYFGSQDEEGADYKRGTRPPDWGSHLWRLKLPMNKWEHLFAVPEGLIAIAGGGWRIYALGYFGHKVYQYDIRTGEVRSVQVGSVDGHISRNIVSDFRDHVYVPRLRRGTLSGHVSVSLVEYDARLKEVRETPLEHYFDKSPAESHGLTAFQPMADGSIIIVTALGYMYRIIPRGTRPAEVVGLGWFHPDGQRYVASLFTYAGERYIMGLARGGKDTYGDRPCEWVVRDLWAEFAITIPFRIHSLNAPSVQGCLLYGSVTRDNMGNFYVVGSHWGKQRPLALKVQCPPLGQQPSEAAR